MSTHRKQILTLGPLNLSYTGRELDITPEFVENLRQNLINNVVEIAPIVVHDQHTEDPLMNHGEVKGLVIEGDKVMVVFELDDGTDIDLKEHDAYPLMHLNYVDTRTGEHVGPVLLHVLLKPKWTVGDGPSGL